MAVKVGSLNGRVAHPVVCQVLVSQGGQEQVPVASLRS